MSFFLFYFRCVMISDCMFLSAIVTIFKCKLKLILLFQLMKFGFSFQVENCLNAIETSYFVIHQNNIRKQKGGYGGCNIWAATIHCQHWRKSELFKYTADWEWRKWPNCCARCEFFISIIIMIHCIISSSETLCLFGLVLGCRQSFFGMSIFILIGDCMEVFTLWPQFMVVEDSLGWIEKWSEE